MILGALAGVIGGFAVAIVLAFLVSLDRQSYKRKEEKRRGE